MDTTAFYIHRLQPRRSLPVDMSATISTAAASCLCPPPCVKLLPILLIASGGVMLTPAQIEATVLFGGVLAGVMQIFYHGDKPTKSWKKAFFFPLLASMLVGYIAPMAIHWKWFETAEWPRWAWLGLSVFTGLCGTMLTTFWINKVSKDGEAVAEAIWKSRVPSIGGGTLDVEVHQKSKPKPKDDSE